MDLSAYLLGYAQGHRGQMGGGPPPTSKSQDYGGPQGWLFNLPIVTPTSWVAWGGGSCRSLTLRRLILMAWRKSGGRRWGWERCVAMVVGSALLSATPWLPGGNKEAAG